MSEYRLATQAAMMPNITMTTRTSIRAKPRNDIVREIAITLFYRTEAYRRTANMVVESFDESNMGTNYANLIIGVSNFPYHNM